MYTDTDRFRDVAGPFMEAGYITGDGRVIKRGKEASVLCCPAHPSLGVPYVALKVYKDQEFRNFRNDAAYLRGRVWKRRDLAHLHAVKDHLWVDTEFRVLTELWEAGVRVPQPYTQIGHGIVMEFVGNADDAAPPLKDVRLPADEAPRVLAEILDALDRMLRAGIVHGDLSAFNILYHGGRAVIIDVPQAIRVSTHDDPNSLFRRDVANVLGYFSRYGLETDAGSTADEIWERSYLPARMWQADA